MTLTAIGNKLRHKNVSYDYITTNVVNALKSVLKIIVEKYLRCRSRCYSEVTVMKFLQISEEAVLREGYTVKFFFQSIS